MDPRASSNLPPPLAGAVSKDLDGTNVACWTAECTSLNRGSATSGAGLDCLCPVVNKFLLWRQKSWQSPCVVMHFYCSSWCSQTIGWLFFFFFFFLEPLYARKEGRGSELNKQGEDLGSLKYYLFSPAASIISLENVESTAVPVLSLYCPVLSRGIPGGTDSRTQGKKNIYNSTVFVYKLRTFSYIL